MPLARVKTTVAGPQPLPAPLTPWRRPQQRLNETWHLPPPWPFHVRCSEGAGNAKNNKKKNNL